MTTNASEGIGAEAASSEKSRGKGLRAYLILTAVAVVALVGYFGYGWLTGNQVSTDDAQLEADVIPIGAKVGGTVVRVNVTDHQIVKKGEVVAELDPADFEIRVAEARAELDAAMAQAESRAPKSGERINTAQVAAARAALAKAEAELRKAESDLTRAKSLRSQNAVTPVELENAESTVLKARASRDEARAHLEVTKDQHGFAEAKVKAAEAALLQAETQLGYAKIIAPSDGVLSKLAVHEGQIIQPGQTVVQLVDHEAYVVANFKETQIGRMRPGQRAEIDIDAYPGQKITGRVESVAPATGARFSLLPPDNASGNFVKVVQRVPVRIKLDPMTNKNVPLRAGLSAEVTVDFE